MTDFTSIPRRLFNILEASPESVRHQERNADGVFVPMTNAEFAEIVKGISKSLIASGFENGDRIAIMGNTQAKWTLAHIGAQCAAGIAAGIYKTNSCDQVEYIVNDSGAKFLILNDEELLAKNTEILDKIPTVQKIVLMSGSSDDERVLTWDEFLAIGSDLEDSVVFDRIDSIKPNDVVTLIYTSGTTGLPKGVMLSARNCEFVGTLLTLDYKEIFGCPTISDYVSYLPLSHVAEQMFTIFGPACTEGMINWYCPDITQVAATLAEVRPHIIFGPPRIWEKFFAGISAKIPEGVTVDQLPEPNKEGIKKAIGFDRCKLAMTGAAPIAASILGFYAQLGINIAEIYGQSEGSGPTSCNLPGATKLGSVGKPLKETEVVIAEDGEILFRGPQVFLGYWNNEEKTKETLNEDGFVLSGDLGKIDEDGYLHIVGRKKDIIITSGGKNITPINMENALKAHPLIGAAVVVGEARPYLNALISLDADVAAAVAAKHGVTVEQFTASPQAREVIGAHIQKVNEGFNRQEQVKKFRILQDPLSVENGTLTPTMKVKRAAVNEVYAHVIDEVYDSTE